MTFKVPLDPKDFMILCSNFNLVQEVYDHRSDNLQTLQVQFLVVSFLSVTEKCNYLRQ